MIILFVAALPCILAAAAYGFYILGRSLVRLAPVFWSKLRQKKKGR